MNSVDEFGFARQAWIDASQFHDLSDEEVLLEVASRVARGGTPMVLLDLDSTLYEVGPRTLRIIHDWVDSTNSRSFSNAREKCSMLKKEQVGYSVRDTLENVGVHLRSSEDLLAFKSLKEFWSKRFFSNEYLKFDRPYPGAVKFVQDLHHQGAEIIYLTGREETGMKNGTRDNLVRDGFPLEGKSDKARLYLKRSIVFSDKEHKISVASEIRSTGDLIASFENEPPNLIALHRVLPDSMHVFVDTICSDHLAPPGSGLYRISSFGCSGSAGSN